jgi:pentatricopeptide repeat protein
MIGCAREEEPPANLHLIAALRTAVSAQNAKWLADTKTAMEKAIEKKEMSEKTANEFKEIIKLAEAGNWSEAEELVVDLQESRCPPSNTK